MSKRQRSIQDYYDSRRKNQARSANEKRTMNMFDQAMENIRNSVGYQYCGPGNNREGVIPANDLDAACQVHDEAYRSFQDRGINPYIQNSPADYKMQMDAREAGGPMGLVVDAVFGLKRMILPNMSETDMVLDGNTSYVPNPRRVRFIKKMPFRRRFRRRRRVFRGRKRRSFRARRFKRRFKRGRRFNKRRSLRYTSGPRIVKIENHYQHTIPMNKCSFFMVKEWIPWSSFQIDADLALADGEGGTTPYSGGITKLALTKGFVSTKMRNVGLQPCFIQVYKCFVKQPYYHATLGDGEAEVLGCFKNGWDGEMGATGESYWDAAVTTANVTFITGTAHSMDPTKNRRFKDFFKCYSKKTYMLKGGDMLQVNMKRKKPYVFNGGAQSVVDMLNTQYWLPKLTQVMFMKCVGSLGYKSGATTTTVTNETILGFQTFRTNVYRMMESLQPNINLLNNKDVSAGDGLGPVDVVEAKDGQG